MIGQILGLFIYILLATLITYFFCKHRLFTLQTLEELCTSIKAFIFGVPITILFKLMMKPYLKIYYNISTFNIYYLLFSTIIYFIGFDFVNYVMHRILHTKLMYKYVHSIHHKFKDPTPFGSIAIHPIEMFLNSVIPSTIMSLIIPVHIYVWLFSYGFHLLWTVLIHDGLKNNKFKKYIMDAEHHGIHHKKPSKNYAFVFSWWDVLGDTYSNK